MRILCTLRAATGHFHPLVPLAQAARDAGHEVAFGMPASFAATVERLGFGWFAEMEEIGMSPPSRYLPPRSLGMRFGAL